MDFPHVRVTKQGPEELRRQRHDGQAMRALYAQVPKIECQGKCWDSCTNFDVPPWERHMAEQAGVALLPKLDIVHAGEGPTLMPVCTALDPETRRCRIYAARPMTCRVWGIFEALQCPYGCIPEGGLIPNADALRLLALSFWYGGAPGAFSPEEIDMFVSYPELVEHALGAYERPKANEPIFVPLDQIEWVEEGAE